jgi:pimeloyl-ACP methyl ester carboxylesterase
MSRRFSAQIAVTLAALATLVAAAPVVAAADAGAAADQFFDSNGVKIHYRVWGQAPPPQPGMAQGDPIVLIHGFTASIDTNWVQPGIVDRLDDDFMVVALDLRGHGQSDKPHDPAAYGDEMAMDVVRLLDHLKIEKAHIVGYSLGGFTTLKLVTMHPERFRSATLGGAGWRSPGESGGVDGLAESLESGNGIAPLMIALTPAGQPTPSPEQIKMVNQMLMATNDAKALAAVIRGMGELSVPEDAVRKIEVPMLAVVGEIDPLRAGVDLLDQMLPAEEVEVVVLPGKDHMTAIADPALAKSVHDFAVKQCGCA